jgi:hypothetical protein
MNTIRLSNISLKDFREFLFENGCSKINNNTKGRGGHELWIKKGLTRPITLQTHVDPVPEKVIRSNIKTLGISRTELEGWLIKRHKKKSR